LNHKQAGDGAGLFAAGLAPDQIPVRDALKLLKPVLENAGHLKIGFNVKFTAVLLAQHGIVMQNHDDVELISYALDAGRGSHDLESLAQRWLGHTAQGYGELIGSGKNKLTYDQVAIERATP
jgi:DNA polymerase-1